MEPDDAKPDTRTVSELELIPDVALGKGSLCDALEADIARGTTVAVQHRGGGVTLFSEREALRSYLARLRGSGGPP